MSEVTLTAAVRQNLLSLQSTADLIARTQNRLSTGLRVSSALDDAVAYFQAKGLSDRASDFEEKKEGIDFWNPQVCLIHQVLKRFWA